MKTRIITRQPWGIMPRNGHRLLCADGQIRAAELASTPDTFFSTPARVRFQGKWVSGYATTETPYGLSSSAPEGFAYVFRQHTGGPLPDWPSPPKWDSTTTTWAKHRETLDSFHDPKTGPLARLILPTLEPRT